MNFKIGDKVICIADQGWALGKLTVGKKYIVLDTLPDNIIKVWGDHGISFFPKSIRFKLAQTLITNYKGEVSGFNYRSK